MSCACRIAKLGVGVSRSSSSKILGFKNKLWDNSNHLALLPLESRSSTIVRQCIRNVVSVSRINHVGDNTPLLNNRNSCLIFAKRRSWFRHPDTEQNKIRLQQLLRCTINVQVNISRGVSSDATDDKKYTELKTSDGVVNVLEPTCIQLRHKFIVSAVPMVGFGFMDNLVMLQVGEVLDSTIGVAFGMSTLTAAGFGQIFSDVSGVCFGGIIGSIVFKMGLPRSGLTATQQDLKSTKLASTAGAVFGVILGCLLGMSTLLFMDTSKAERLKRQATLDKVFSHVMMEGKNTMHADRSTLFFYDKESDGLLSKFAVGVDSIGVPRQSIAGETFYSKKIMNIANAYEYPQFNTEIDRQNNYKTKSLLSAPIINSDKEAIGVIQVLNKTDDKGNIVPFTENDEIIITMLSSHVDVFINYMS